MLYIVRSLYFNDPTKIQRKPQQSGEKQEERTGGSRLPRSVWDEEKEQDRTQTVKESQGLIITNN